MRIKNFRFNFLSREAGIAISDRVGFTSSRSARSGQVLILILLVMAVSLTLGVSVASRSIATLKQVSFSAQSAQALAFAEAGAEEALQQRCSPTGNCTPGTFSIDLNGGGDDVTYTITPLSSTDLPKVDRDSTIELTLSGYGGASVTICWSSTSISSETDAALTVAYVRSSGGNYFLSRYSYDPLAVSHENNFQAPLVPTGACAGYRYRAVILTPATQQILRLRSLYVGPVTISAPGLPSQGSKIESTGFSGQVRRKVEVRRTLPALSELFDFAIFSGSEASPLPE
ncbi:MAG: hypothetical protein Q8L46_00500 [candidate division WWE3 bacterium]|nr:hypothetical protein [candidate division WWE3 bacterium]